MEIKTYYIMEYPEFDELIKEKLGIDYESVADNEWNNDSSFTFTDLTKEKISKDRVFMDHEIQVVENAMKGIRDHRMNLWAIYLLNYMVLKDMIPEGNYIIEVCW